MKIFTELNIALEMTGQCSYLRSLEAQSLCNTINAEGIESG